MSLLTNQEISVTGQKVFSQYQSETCTWFQNEGEKKKTLEAAAVFTGAGLQIP